ncbi:MAG: hypothetical protein IPL31_16060 [Saprospiraceae bacterium]|nr:hypothetical protein [Saprospiraceae bacterium]
MLNSKRIFQENPELLFIFIFLTISFTYNYQELLFKKPQSIHKWRQADCASLALNYYQEGMHFFNPQTNNLTSDFGTSGKCCPSEIPILYYAVAILYKIFGYHDSIFRFLNTLLFFIGLLYLFKTLFYLLKDRFWSAALSILFFASPVLAYYGNNYLTNTAALAFSMIAWHYFIRYYFEEKSNWLTCSLLFFLLASAFKITALLSLFAISVIFTFEYFGILRIKTTGKIFKRPIRFIVCLISILSIVGIWILYAKWFNQKHDCFYFSTTIFPIWDLSKEEILGVLDNIKNLWFDQYFHVSVYIFLVICFLYIIYYNKKNLRFFNLTLLLLFLQSIFYIILEFWTFADHDYYVIDLYILPIILVISVFDVLNRHHNKIFKAIPIKFIFLIFLLFNVYYTKEELNARYRTPINDYEKYEALYSISPYLRQIGIMPHDTVISIPDVSHCSLYLMNQKGWTEYTDARFNRGQKISYNQDSLGIQASIDKGAKYMLVNGLDELFAKAYLKSFCTHLIGRYQDVLIFKLKDSLQNFSLEDKVIQKKLKCNAETLSVDGQYFISDLDNIQFEFGKSQSSEQSFNSKFSSKLDANMPYGMTIRFPNLKHAESFSISIWRKAIQNTKAGIVATCNAKQFYNGNYKILEKDTNNWERLWMEFSIPKQLTDQELVIYMYNPDSNPVYFDDLEIKYYKSILMELPKTY